MLELWRFHSESARNGSETWELEWLPVGLPDGRAPLSRTVPRETRQRLEDEGLLAPDKFSTATEIDAIIAGPSHFWVYPSGSPTTPEEAEPIDNGGPFMTLQEARTRAATARERVDDGQTEPPTHFYTLLDRPWVSGLGFDVPSPIGACNRRSLSAACRLHAAYCCGVIFPCQSRSR